MDNSSMIDDMPNIKGNFSNEIYVHDETSYEKIFLEVFTFVGLLSVTANILLSFVIIKYKRLRKDPTSKIFLQVNILQAVYMVTTPITIRVGMLLFSIEGVQYLLFCLSYQVEGNLAFGIVWFIFLLLSDWYIKVYHKDTYAKFCSVYKFFVIALYIFIVLSTSLTIQICFQHWMTLFSYLVMLACVGLLVLVLCVINIVHAIRKRRILVNNRSGNFGLAIANILFLCWIPGIIYFFILVAGVYIHAPISVIIIFAIGHLSPVCNLIYLFNYDDNYHIFLKLVFRCRCSEYSNESLDNRSVVYSDSNGVQISDNV